MENDSFIFRDGRGMTYKVAWEDRQSWLFSRRSSGDWNPLRQVAGGVELEAMMALEINPAEYTAYENRVEMIGRMFFMVKSHSRPDVMHLVDMEHNVFGEPPACSCEQNRFRKCKCRHLLAVEEFLGGSRS